MNSNVVVATVAALALSAVGCGGSKPLTSAELTSKASAICRQRTAEIAALRTKHRGDFRALIAAGLPVEEKTVGELAKLKPPASAKVDYERFVAIEKIALVNLKAYVAGTNRSATRENVRRTHELMRIEPELGLADCQ